MKFIYLFSFLHYENNGTFSVTHNGFAGRVFEPLKIGTAGNT